jgi:hypothetical protein
VKQLLVFLSIASILRADLLYQTDFDNFPSGSNQWGGNDGWVTNDATSGAQSIDDSVIPALFKTASLGFKKPNSTFTFVALDLGYDHVATGSPVVEIDTLLGIEDSSTIRRDDFFLSIYNSLGNRLASIRFDNQNPTAFESQFGIWRENGTHQFDTQLDFIQGELFNLFITLDLEANTWSADIGGIPLFDTAQFTNTGNPVNLGFIAFEWALTDLSALGYGDNFLLVADLSVRSIVEAPNPPFIVSHLFDSSDSITLSWSTSVGFDDQVQYSTDLENWFDDLQNSSFNDISNSSTVSFTDISDAKGPIRFYRVKRTTEP